MSETKAPPPPTPRLCVGVTGHRLNHAALRTNEAALRGVVRTLFAKLDALALQAPATPRPARPRLHSMLADGADQFCADAAFDLGWEIAAPLPFGLPLTIAAAIEPEPGQAEQLLDAAKDRVEGGAAAAVSPGLRARIDAFLAHAQKASVFALADRDAQIEDLFRRRAQGDADAHAAYAAETSHRYTLASRIVVEQSDLIIAIWDGASRTAFGGTGHTIAIALDHGVPVLWLKPDAPGEARILRTPEDLTDLSAMRPEADIDASLAHIAEEALRPERAAPAAKAHGHGGAPNLRTGLEGFLAERWSARSNPFWHGYRRIEALFGEDGRPFANLRQTYAAPETIADGAWRGFLDRIAGLPGLAREHVAALKEKIAPRFAWADGVSTHLSDAYRGSMILNFALSALAAIGGLTYLPFFTYDEKWVFAVVELFLLCAIVFVTYLGGRQRWHGRWFESRRVAEYLRHTPILLAVGAARPIGRWPRGVETSWPEWYARQSVRDVGLPKMAVTQAYLRAALTHVLRPHAAAQRDYHMAKAKKLRNVHDNLDRLSMALFIAAIVVVAGYVALIALEALGAAHILDGRTTSAFTYFGVVLPLLGATIAGVRYFGDFERFSSISEVAAEKLDQIARRIDVLLAPAEPDLDYESVSRLAHAMDDVVVGEIESWQAVFGGKHITIPV